MQHLNQFPIWRDANRWLLGIEQVVRRFPRYNNTRSAPICVAHQSLAYAYLVEDGYLPSGMKHRVMRDLFDPIALSAKVA